MGNSRFQPRPGTRRPTRVFSRGYVENEGLKLAPQVGLEPTTLRLTAIRVVATSRCKHKTYTRQDRVSPLEGLLGGLPQYTKQNKRPARRSAVVASETVAGYAPSEKNCTGERGHPPAPGLTTKDRKIRVV